MVQAGMLYNICANIEYNTCISIVAHGNWKVLSMKEAFGSATSQVHLTMIQDAIN